MSDLLRQAALDAGLIDADCLRLMEFSRDPPAEQIARFKATHPHLFYLPSAFNARTAPMAEVNKRFAEMQRAEARRQADAAGVRTVERLQAERAAADAYRAQRDAQLRERQEAEQRRLAERHARQRGG